MILANLRLMLSLRFSGKNAGVAQKTSENKPDPRTGHAREGVRHPKHRLAVLADELEPLSSSTCTDYFGRKYANHPHLCCDYNEGGCS